MLLLIACLLTQTPTADDPLSIGVITFGPGDDPFSKFGHNAIWVHDARTGRDDVYNYGTFSFDDIALVPRFFLGRFDYWLSVSPLAPTLHLYRRLNRDVVIQKLDLTPAEELKIQDYLQWNSRPENRHYRYHYYKDNCSTRVRDVIDRAIGGRIQATATTARPLTYRDHSLRLTHSFLPEYLVLDVALADYVDRPITAWDETFVPMALRDVLRDVTVERDDGSQPLVGKETVWHRAERPEELASAPRWWPHFLTAGTLGGLLLVALAEAGRRRRLFARLGRLIWSVEAAILGFLGVNFVLLWALTDHDVAYANENLLLCAPWCLVVPLFAALSRRPWALRVLRVLTYASALAAVAALALKVLPTFNQDNWRMIAFFLPLYAGASWSAWRN